jgi:hypothetical protein
VLGYVAFKPDGQTPDPDVPQQHRFSDGDDVVLRRLRIEDILFCL